MRKHPPRFVKSAGWPKPSASSMRLLNYFDTIDDKDGKALWMDFFRIAGSTANTDRWLKYMLDRFLISELVEVKDGKERKCYQKTKHGNDLHNILKRRDLVGILTQELPRRKLRRVF